MFYSMCVNVIYHSYGRTPILSEPSVRLYQKYISSALKAQEHAECFFKGVLKMGVGGIRLFEFLCFAALIFQMVLGTDECVYWDKHNL